MATYHLRLKNDTKSGGGKVSAKRHAGYILREDGKSHADYINREGSQITRMIVFSRAISCPNGRRVPRKNFSLRQLAMKTKEMCGTEKLNCRFRMN